MNQENHYGIYFDCAENALANYLGTDDLDQNMVELVTDCMRSAVEALPNWSYFTNILEKSSSYVQCDLDEDDLLQYTACLEDMMEEFGLL